MPTFAKISTTTADDDVARTFADIKRVLKIHFVPHFFRTLANSPTVLAGTWAAYKNVGWQGQLPSSTKEMVFTAIAAARDCKYCETAHLAFCKMLGVDADNLRAIVKDIAAVEPAHIRDIVRFGVDCALDPIGITEARCDELRAHGMTDGEIIELMAMVSFSLYATNLADAMKLEIDEDFKQMLGGSAEAV